MIGIVGDYQPANPAHCATTDALEHASAAAGLKLDHAWLPAPEIASRPEAALYGADAVLIAPRSPYESMGGALAAARRK